MAREDFQHPGGGRLLTKQADAGEADINTIVRRARQVGALPPPGQPPRYGDFTGVESFHAALSLVKSAEAEFGALPSAVRQACENDVGVFLEMVHSPAGLLELQELGLPGVSVPESARTPAAPAAAEPQGGGSGDLFPGP